MIESMESMQKRVIERANVLRKPGEQYPKAVALFPGIVAIAHTKEEHCSMVHGNAWAVVAGIVLSIGIVVTGVMVF